MKTLPPEFTKLGFTHRQIERQGNIAIFERKKPHWAHSHFEVIRVRQRPACFHHGQHHDASEGYPSPEHWGTLAFTCTDLASARTRATKILKSGENTQK